LPSQAESPSPAEAAGVWSRGREKRNPTDQATGKLSERFAVLFPGNENSACQPEL